MSNVIKAIKIVFAQKRYVLLGIASGLAFGALLVFGTGLVTFFPDGAYIELDKAGIIRLITLAAIVILSGLVVPMQFYAVKKAKAAMGGKGITAASFVVSLSTMSCCAPLLLPALLSFIGFSGVQILSLNIAIRQYLLPLSLFSVGLLGLSLFMAARTVMATACKIEAAHKNTRT